MFYVNEAHNLMKPKYWKTISRVVRKHSFSAALFPLLEGEM